MAFDYLDKDKTGYIEKAELAGLMEGFETDEVLDLMLEMDKNNDSKISKEEFTSYMNNITHL